MSGFSQETRRVGRFELVEQIGAGGFGETWRAHDSLLDVDVAIKLFHSPDPAQRERYVREARSMARLSDLRGIAHVRDLVEENGRICLVMDYVEGEDLSRLIERQGRLSLQQTLRVLEPVAAALSVLHAKGVVHRDVSPDNIRVSSDGRGTLLDFGSVLSSSQSQGGTIVVKPGYAPPEQYGDTANQGPWTDVYALAATAYQCLCAAAPSDSLQRTFNDDLADPRLLGAALTADEEQALMAALALDYHARTQTVDELMDGLRGKTQRSGEAQGETPAPEPVAKPTVMPEPRPSAQTAVATPAPTPTKTPAPTPTSTPTRTPTPTPTPTRTQSSASRRKASRGIRTALIAAAVALVLVVAGVLVFSRVGSSGSSEPTENITSETISNERATQLAHDTQKTAVSFTGCVVSEDALKVLAESQTIESVTINMCTGFTSLEPLASMSGLKELNLIGVENANLDELFPSTMANLECLRLETMSIESGVEVLGRFPSLTTLALSPVEGVSDLSFLDKLGKLESLDLSGIDLSGDAWQHLSSLPALKYAYVNACNLPTVEWAQSCPDLVELEAQGNQVSDLAPLAGHEALATLKLSKNQISDVSALASCPELKDVQLALNNISSTEGLADHDSLWRLTLASNQLASIDDLASLVALEQLSLEHNELTSIDALAKCVNLELLDVSNNQLASIDVCERFIALEMLDASHNAIASIDRLAPCSQLTLLLVQDNDIDSIAALGNDFIELKTLNISHNRVSSLEPLANCSKLVYVLASHNAITSLDGMGDKPELELLLADHNQIGNIEAISTSTGVLWNVDLGYNEISDVSALSGMLEQDTFDLRATLLLDHNKVASAESLPFDVKFNALSLHGNPLTDFPKLPEDDIYWFVLYLPYSEDFAYENLGDLPLIGSTCIVDAPLDQQNAILRALEIAPSDAFSARPKFISEAEADSDMTAIREELQQRVSGMSDSSELEEDANA